MEHKKIYVDIASFYETYSSLNQMLILQMVIVYKPGQNTRYPLPVPELPEPGPELPEPEVPDPKFG